MPKALIFFCWLAFILTGCKPENNSSQELVLGKIFAQTKFISKSGSKTKGQAWFAQDKNGIQIIVSVKDVEPGFHGIHIHEHGDCSAPDASSAGGHFNPGHKNHGEPQPQIHHIGDLGNIIVGKDRHGLLNLAIPSSRFMPDFDWQDIIGKALVLHQSSDDLVSQPSGASGARIACGIIEK